MTDVSGGGQIDVDQAQTFRVDAIQHVLVENNEITKELGEATELKRSYFLFF